MSTVVHRNETLSGWSVSWAAIFSGVFTSAGIGSLFSLFGMAIGLALFKPDGDVISSLSIAADDVLSSIALYAFLTMVLGLAASILGSLLGIKWNHDRR